MMFFIFLVKKSTKNTILIFVLSVLSMGHVLGLESPVHMIGPSPLKLKGLFGKNEI
jgi:hypothetical protein